MRIINTDETKPDDVTNQWERDQVYNGLDCVVTLEVLETIIPQLDDCTRRTYTFSRALQGPTLEMRLRGVLVDQGRKQEVIDTYHDKIDQLEQQLEQIVLDGVGMPTFSWRSNPDLHKLFYQHLQIPVIRSKGRPTVDRTALEKMEVYLIAKPIVAHLMAMRDLAKKISVLKTGIDPDGRMRTSYNIAGTNTGRFSSSFSEFGTGGNLQNVEELLRSIFVADPGYKFAKFDAKSGESYCVGAIEWNLFKDGRYLDAVESGDVHTAVARICWSKLGWTGDLNRDKHIAERPYYRHYSYRFMCKKLGHGSNYGGQPKTLAGQAKLPETVVRDFQPKYFQAFPAHLLWHGSVDRRLRTEGYLISLSGRKRWFFGRRNDPSTLREAIAYDPQGSLADIVNRAMLRIWRKRTAILMMQDHDALTFMYPEELEDEIIPALQEDLVEEIPLQHGRVLRIPYDCKVGWNKGDVSEANPDGLKDYAGQDQRRRQPQVSLLDRILRRGNGRA
jgi:DNA polymerase-1